MLVWVPGGAYRVGGAALPVYDGAHLAAHDVVVVGLNYRLGALGWLATEGVPTNLPLRDLRAAVDWLRTNIAAFGGDPDRIVLMGESAGSGTIAHLLAAYPDLPWPARSSRAVRPPARSTPTAAAWVADNFLTAAGASSVDDLRDASVEALLAAQDQTVADALLTVGMMPFHPWVDGDLLHGRAHESPLPAIPLVVGTTAHEMELFRDQVPVLPPDIAVPYLAGKAAHLGITDDACVRTAYGAAGHDMVEAVADLELHVPNELLARAHAARGNQVYRYRFMWEAPERRACHALDLPFTFGNFDVSTWREFAGALGERAAAAEALVDPDARGLDLLRCVRHAERHGRRSVVERRPRVPRRTRGHARHRVAPHRDLVGGRVSALPGKVAIVTGASRGIGKGIALELGAAGATVYVTARSTSEADHPLPGTIGATALEIDAIGADAGGKGHRRRSRPPRRRRGRGAVRPRARRARPPRRAGEQRVHRDRPADVGAAVLGGRHLELGRHRSTSGRARPTSRASSPRARW